MAINTSFGKIFLCHWGRFVNGPMVEACNTGDPPAPPPRPRSNGFATFLCAQVMHDVHDQAVALARLCPATGRITSVLDLQLAHEAVGGDARNSLGDALLHFSMYDRLRV